MSIKVRVKIDPNLFDQKPNFARGLALIYLKPGEPEPYPINSNDKKWFTITLKGDLERKFIEIQETDKLNNTEIIKRALWAIKKRCETHSF